MISTNTHSQLQKETIKFLTELVEKGGPEPYEYQAFTDIVNHLKPAQVDPFREIIKPSLNENTLIGHGFVKPYGYPGDFHLIHNIYKRKANPDPNYKSWDDFFLNQPAAEAVRNRKDFFLKSCKRLEENNSKEINVLILGCGPATDVNQYITENPESKIRFDLLDFDQNAIDFAKAQNELSNGSIEYFRINVLRYKPYKYYDLIWSAGLFDYFKEKHFIYLINKYHRNLTDNGEFLIGNFSHLNPTKRLMEVLSDWYLNHRSRYDLIR
ncbi:MAG: class I SAM-dependent methyltransferase, partial [Candidatus Heimdallarchaeota archaeon]|nr:class I SAM-dependent methyltransferase [Candidatus Heimdallarchaeota archaeon]